MFCAEPGLVTTPSLISSAAAVEAQQNPATTVTIQSQRMVFALLQGFEVYDATRINPRGGARRNRSGPYHRRAGREPSIFLNARDIRKKANKG
jgi:hypothetical protein